MGQNLMGGQPMPPGATQMRINPDDCPRILCTWCDCPDFVQIVHLKAVSVLVIPPNGGHLNELHLLCTNCNTELDLERAKKWAFLSEENRTEAQSQMIQAIKEKEAKNVTPKNPTG